MRHAYGILLGLLAPALLTSASGCSAGSDGASSDHIAETEISVGTSELASGGLTKKQASTVLKLVDDICGDTWCEGDHNFNFDRIQCTLPCGKASGSCRLAFRIFSYDSDLDTGPTYARECKVTGFTGFASLVETSQNGYQSLAWTFYDALSECIAKLETELPPI
jgi:hypothetical protein